MIMAAYKNIARSAAISRIGRKYDVVHCEANEAQAYHDLHSEDRLDGMSLEEDDAIVMTIVVGLVDFSWTRKLSVSGRMSHNMDVAA